MPPAYRRQSDEESLTIPVDPDDVQYRAMLDDDDDGSEYGESVDRSSGPNRAPNLPFGKAFLLFFVLFGSALVLGVINEINRPAAPIILDSSSSSSSSTGAPMISSSSIVSSTGVVFSSSSVESSSSMSISSSSSSSSDRSSSSSSLLSSSSSSSSSSSPAPIISSSSSSMLSSSSSSMAFSSSSSSSSSSSPRKPTVHVVSSSHLDVGFANLAVNIVNEHFTKYFPLALNITAECRAANVPYSWMTHSYLISLYFDCPPNMGLICPTIEERTAVAAGIARGDIQFHAFPFNSEFELYSPDLFKYGIQMSQDLAQKYMRVNGLPNTVSQRDVPGTTRAIIPLLNQMGVKAMSFGQNGAAPPVRPYPAGQRMPAQNIFLWTDPFSGKSIYTMLHGGGYGGIGKSDAVIIDGFDQVLIMDWNGDNAGPYSSVDFIKSHVDAIQSDWPGYEVIASTFDAFVDEVDAAYQAGLIRLYETSDEMGDTWMYGAGGDPMRTGPFMILQKLRSDCLLDVSCDSATYAFHNFSRLLMRAGEHTWGCDHKTFLKSGDPNGDYYAWNNSAYHNRINEQGFQFCHSSFVEQREWSINIPLSALPVDHPIVVKSAPLIAAMNPSSSPIVEGLTPTDVRNFVVDGLRITIGPSGELNGLLDARTLKAYADPQHPLALINYQVFDDASYKRFLGAYANCDIYTDCPWAFYDYGKQGLDQSVNISARTVNPIISSLYYNVTGFSTGTIYVNLTFGALQDFYRSETGAAQEMWLVYRFNTTNSMPFIDIELTWINKTDTRVPEAWWLTFISAAATNTSISKMGTSIDASHVMFNGSRHLHGSIDSSEDPLVVITPHTTPLLCLGSVPTPFPTPLPQNNALTPGISYGLFNNIWGTNYPYAYPIIPADANTAFSFTVALKPDGPSSSSSSSTAGVSSSSSSLSSS